MTARPRPPRVERHIDLPYGSHARQVLDLDIPQTADPPPLVVSIHGGGWMSGSEDRAPGRQALVRAGFAVASVRYRLSREAPWPACLEDCRAAISWLTHGPDAYRFGYRLNSLLTVGLIGRSAGAHLAAMLALEGRGEACVGVATPTDLPLLNDTGDRKAKRALALLFGGQYSEPLAIAASPVEHVMTSVPPFLLVHGTADGTVPGGQSMVLAARIRAVGGEVNVIRQRGVGHPADLRAAMPAIVAFLTLHLRPGRHVLGDMQQTQGLKPSGKRAPLSDMLQERKARK